MDEQNDAMMSPDEEVEMILRSKKDVCVGPTSFKLASFMANNQASSSQDDNGHHQKSRSRSMGHSRTLWDESLSDSSPFDTDIQVYPSVEEFLSSIPKFNADQRSQIPFYFEILGDKAKDIKTELPKSNHFTDEEMEVLKSNFILRQLHFLFRENFSRSNEMKRREDSGHLALIKKPLAIRPKQSGYKTE